MGNVAPFVFPALEADLALLAGDSAVCAVGVPTPDGSLAAAAWMWWASVEVGDVDSSIVKFHEVASGVKVGVCNKSGSPIFEGDSAAVDVSRALHLVSEFVEFDYKWNVFALVVKNVLIVVLLEVVGQGRVNWDSGNALFAFGEFFSGSLKELTGS